MPTSEYSDVVCLCLIEAILEVFVLFNGILRAVKILSGFC